MQQRNLLLALDTKINIAAIAFRCGQTIVCYCHHAPRIGFDIKPVPRAKFPIKMEDFPHYTRGISGVEMPINIVPRNAKRLGQLDGYFEEALAARPQYVSHALENNIA